MNQSTVEFLTFAITVASLVGSWIYYFSKIGVTLQLIKEEIKEIKEEIKKSQDDRAYFKSELAAHHEANKSAHKRLDALEGTGR